MFLKITVKKAPLSIIIGLVFFLSLAACKPANQKVWPEFSVTENTELGCIEFHRDGDTYRPYGVLKGPKLRGDQIGIRKGEPDCKIYELRGYDAAEWIIDYLDVFMGGGLMLFKAVGVTEIPAELEQYREYDF